MTEIVRTALGATQVPDGWPVEASGTRVLTVDAFGADKTDLIIARPPDDPLLQTLQIETGGKTIAPVFSAIPRGCRARLDAAPGGPLTIRLGPDALTVPVHAIADELAGRNVMFSVIAQARAHDLRIWLEFHARTQGADAALIFNRLPQDNRRIVEALEKTPPEGIERLIWVDVPVPVGHPGLGPETARHFAPDAPGKANLPPLASDPWRSALHQVTLLEVARLRFLCQARAVLFATPADLMRADYDSGDSVFDAAVNGTGFVRFPGRRAYPFHLVDPVNPQFAEHNCMAFDGKASDHIWCAAPGTLPDDAFWRQFRVGATPDPKSSDFSYWRCMAMRHPGLKPSELAPRTALIEDNELIDLMSEEFDGADAAKTPPQSGQLDKSAWKNERILIVTTMKNEGPFIIDWLAYHRAIGVTDFLVYTNDCTDGTDRFFELLADKGLVRHKQNPFRQTGERPQHAAIHDAAETELAAAADWIICMDVDEYINIHVGDGTLAALFDAVPDANLISLTWRLFGNGDVAAFDDRPVTEQFRLAAAAMTRKPHQAWGFKTLFRNAGFYKKFGVHRPKGLRPEYLDHIRWVNGSGQPMPQSILRSGWRSNTSTVGYDLVTLNHYALRSAESFLVKRDRGRVNHTDRDQGLAYWFRMNHNATEDRSIDSKRAVFEAERARLLADGDIAAMHAASVDAHRTRIAELLADAGYRELFETITGPRLRALSRQLHHFGTKVFLQGPDAVPEDFQPTNR